MVDQQNNFTEKLPDIIRRNAFKPVPTSENGFSSLTVGEVS
jgi:hypothetical protein